ncbi:MAG: acyl--CoA ligase [Deltaproteobacteria bacterium]|uniref:class I adenylate-forming enzyme family protein n=1 Tax=Desulfobacula sp. TaxID=2593537 RepID=UPI001995F327|nr:acyl--CoA ligase [Candidatus Desulfobacula maris]MBL6992629.1 acyl--CoA ligase [Desulfobacula sp.]
MRSVAELLTDCFQKHSKKTALSFFRGNRIETRISFQDLDVNSTKMASLFIKQGVKKSDNVVLLLDKSLVFVVAHIALQKIGAVSVPLNPGFKKSELTYLLNDAAPSLVIVSPELAGMIRQIDPTVTCMEIDTKIAFQALDILNSCSRELEKICIVPDDPGLIIYTSGTTGNPKGAVLTQKNLVNDASDIIRIWEISESDTLCHSLPLFHVHGLCFALHTALISGSHVMLLDRFDPDVVLDILKETRPGLACTIFMAVPAMYSKLMDALQGQTPCFDHMRLWTSGSAPLPVKEFQRITQAFGKEPVEREGMSETGMNFSNPLKGEKKPGSIGIPLPGVTVRIVDHKTLLDAEPGQTGEFWLKSDSIISRYWKKPEETAMTFENGWFKTGDLGKKDSDGYYYLTDRLKNIIITGGENVSPNEIEGVINRVDGVIESSVLGIFDEKWGEKIVAAVVKTPASGDINRQIKDTCKEHLHDWKCPKQIIFIKKLPRNTMGKILKEDLKKLF